MAIVVSATPDTRVLRLEYNDVDGENVIKTFELAGDVADAAVETFLEALEAISNPNIIKASISTQSLITGFKGTPTNAIQNSVGYVLDLLFTTVDPVNAAKVIRKGFIVPGPIAALKDTDLLPVSGNANLNAVTSFLEDNLNLKAHDGVYYAGIFTYLRARSRFGTLNRRIDALPG